MRITENLRFSCEKPETPVLFVRGIRGACVFRVRNKPTEKHRKNNTQIQQRNAPSKYNTEKRHHRAFSRKTLNGFYGNLRNILPPFRAKRRAKHLRNFVCANGGRRRQADREKKERKRNRKRGQLRGKKTWEKTWTTAWKTAWKTTCETTLGGKRGKGRRGMCDDPSPTAENTDNILRLRGIGTTSDD